MLLLYCEEREQDGLHAMGHCTQVMIGKTRVMTANAYPANAYPANSF